MKRVAQENENDCAAACVAMLAGVTLDGAKTLLPARCEAYGTFTKHLRDALLVYGLETDALRSIGNRDFADFSFDAALRGWLEDDWHWVVWDAKRKKVLDPYEPGYVFRCTSFVKVTRRP